MNFMDFIVGLELSGRTESFSDKQEEKSMAEPKATTKPLENHCADCKKCEKHLEKCIKINRDTLEKLCIESLKSKAQVYWLQAKCDNICKDIDEDFINLLKRSGKSADYQKCDTESLKAEKKCECKCKSNQDFHKELLEQFKECEEILYKGTMTPRETVHFLSIFHDMVRKLQAEIEKADTAKSKI